MNRIYKSRTSGCNSPRPDRQILLQDNYWILGSVPSADCDPSWIRTRSIEMKVFTYQWCSQCIEFLNFIFEI